MYWQDMEPHTSATETGGGTMEPAAIDKSLDEPDATDDQNIGPILDRLKRIEGQVRGPAEARRKVVRTVQLLSRST
ncbi:MAG: hypothetical protein EBT47_09965 [Chloroflexi bacterium]|nr:hypothetical protein [Chloroflexota bacterium]